MLAVVIPAHNEAAQIQNVLRQVLRIKAGLVIPVLNGCTDMTAEMTRRASDPRIRPVHFREALGYDVPRIAGARAALQAGATAVLFVDADLSGPILGCLISLAAAVRRDGLDLALCDCYQETPTPDESTTAGRVFAARTALNQSLGRRDLGPAIPSHGPSAVSRRLLLSVPEASVGIPPLMQAHAVLAKLRVGTAARLPHRDLGSSKRSRIHRTAIAQTIIGDCYEGISLAEGRESDRQRYDGYHSRRRFDLLGLSVATQRATHSVTVGDN